LRNLISVVTDKALFILRSSSAPITRTRTNTLLFLVLWSYRNLQTNRVITYTKCCMLGF